MSSPSGLWGSNRNRIWCILALKYIWLQQFYFLLRINLPILNFIPIPTSLFLPLPQRISVTHFASPGVPLGALPGPARFLLQFSSHSLPSLLPSRLFPHFCPHPPAVYPLLSFPLSSFLYPCPLLNPATSGGAVSSPSGSGQSPAAKRFRCILRLKSA